MKLMSSALLSVAGLLFSGCNNEPAAGKVKAKVEDAVLVATSGNEGAQADGAPQYTFSANGSKIEFLAAKVTRKHAGSFGQFSGTISVPGGDPTRGAVNVEVTTASLSVDAEKLIRHLKDPDFLDVEKFPTARFSSTRIQPGGDQGTHTVTGNLELHGVTRSITFPATIQVAGDHVDVKAEFAINRQDFGIAYPGAPDDLIKDDVLIHLDISAKHPGT